MKKCKLECKDCKNSCCEGRLNNRITGEINVILPKRIKYICTNGIQLIRVSRLKWKCRFLKRGKCSIYENRPFLCKYFFCRNHKKKKNFKMFNKTQGNSVLELQFGWKK